MFADITGFAPDLDPTTPGIITDGTNIVPTLRGYAGAATGANTGMDALATAPISAATVTRLGGTSRMFAGTATKIYEKSLLTWSDVSRVAAYNASASFPWRFAQYGDTSLAVNKGDVVQSSSGASFSDLTAPKAALIATSSGFAMLANTNEGTYGDSPDRWWCSALYDITDWVPAIATQCATGRLVETAGAIMGLKPLGQDIVAYKEKSLYLGRYSGPPGVWQFQLIPGEIGCSSNEAIADIDVAHIFIGDSDIYRFDGTRPVPIGAPLREWFFGDLDPAYRYKMTHAVDRVNALVYFHYPRAGGSGALNGCIVYNYKSNKWGVAHRSIEAVVDYVTGGYTWDTLPITTWDSWPAVAYDSPFWTASSRYPSYFASDFKVYSLTGGSSTASITTGSYGAENQQTLLQRVNLRYFQIPTTATMTNYYQDTHGGTWTTDATTTESMGRFDVLRSAPWHRAKFDFTGDFEVSAISADIIEAGVL